ncbi:DUF4404 domain-containing protein [Candidatus Marinamargulisbacteria bacterium SCGC AAA071-K20]|nr:DUF4404 domain-containing protein [Candidatus Marinamargulisbacteria bacterium SCGC AAA071-K20]
MINETIKKIEDTLKKAKHISEEKRKELNELLSSLKNEVSTLSETQPDDAKSIVGFAEVATHEALRDTQKNDLLSLAQNGLDQSVQEFTSSHPNLSAVVKTLTRTLSNLGV